MSEIKPEEGCRIVTEFERANNDKPSFATFFDSDGHWAAVCQSDSEFTGADTYAVPIDFKFPVSEPVESAEAITITQDPVEFKPVVITISTQAAMTAIVNECQDIDDHNGESYAIVRMILDAVADNKIMF